MRRFRFNLEKVLKLRIKEEEQVRAEFKAAMERVIRIEKERDALQEQQRNTEADLFQERSKHSLLVRRILMLEEGFRRFAEALSRVRQRLEGAEMEADRIRLRLEQVKARRESLERLKSRQRRRYEAMARTEERKRMDEVAVVRFLRQRPGEQGAHERSS